MIAEIFWFCAKSYFVYCFCRKWMNTVGFIAQHRHLPLDPYMSVERMREMWFVNVCLGVGLASAMHAAWRTLWFALGFFTLVWAFNTAMLLIERI